MKLKASLNGILSLLKEIKVHWVLEECEGILRLIEIYEDNQYVYLVLEYQRQGSLLGKLTQTQVIDEQKSKFIMEQLLLTLDYIH